MLIRLVAVIIMLVLSGTEATAKASAQNVRGKGKKAAAKVKEDFSTPRAAVETFFAAAAARDADLLSRCFASNAAREFEKVRNKKLSKKELDAVAEEFGSGEATDVRQTDETKAVVAVRLKSRDERIEMVKTVSGWKIVDF